MSQRILSDGTECTIRDASINDSAVIYDLLREGFAPYLRYTIYRSPNSVSYIRELLQSERIDSAHFIRVAESRGLQAYYHAQRNGDSCFLSYIAVSRTVHGMGFGTLLL